MTKTYYSTSHEYVRVEDGVATIGITSFAQGQLGDIVFVEIPEAGTALNKGDEAAVVESVKAASEVYAPLSGELTAANDALVANPALANEDPEGEGWFLKLRIKDEADLSQLMDQSQYEAFVKESE